MERLTLTAQESKDIGSLVDEAGLGLKHADREEWAARAAVQATLLPPRLRRFLAGIRAREVEVAVLSGLPVGTLPPTPEGWPEAAEGRAGLREEHVLLLCAAGLAEPFGWASQQNGRLVHDICPAPAQETSLTSASSKTALSLHTEDVFHPCRADYVVLYCLRNPDQVATTVARISSCPLSSTLSSVLSQNRFRFRADDSHAGRGTGGPAEPGDVGAVLFGPARCPYLRYDRDFTDAAPYDNEASTALETLGMLLSANIEQVVLEPGDILILDNHRVVHGRNPFQARLDGTDRWLKRVNLIRDARRIYRSTGSRSRILAPCA